MNLKAASATKLLTTIFSITGVVLLFIGYLRCNFVKFTSTDSIGTDPVSLEFGIWFYLYWSFVGTTNGVYVFESCYGYPPELEIDGAWKAARSFSVLSGFFGLFTVVFSCSNAFSSKPGKPGEAVLYLVMALFTGLTLLILNSNVCNENIMVQIQDAALTNFSFPDTCSMATGANLAVSATVFFVLSAVTSLLGQKASERETDGVDGLDEPLNP